MTKIKTCLALCFALSGIAAIILPVQAAEPYSASRTEQSYAHIINLAPGKAFTFWVKFENRGTRIWANSGENAVRLKAANFADENESAFRHPFWHGPYEPAKLSEETIEPGETGIFRFAIQGAEEEGFYWAKFNLMAGENKVLNTHLEIPIRIIKGHPATAEEQAEANRIAAAQEESSCACDLQTPASSLQPPALNLQEPLIRIGLYDTAKPLRIAASGKYEIKDSEDNLLATKTDGKELEAEYDFSAKKYHLKENGRRIVFSDSYFRFVPDNRDIIMRLANYENRPAWNQNLNDNEFRGTIEYHYNSNNGKVWVINELPMEDYLLGMAEAHNDSPHEHLIAMSIAERTYAFYHYNDPCKHADQDFLLTPTEGDQVYRGYGTEQRLHNVVAAAKATQGLVVTYDDEIVNTPYFTQSDGRTRAWEEVWSGHKPWLISKPDPDCDGLARLGHGVGMSARGAKARAEKGATYDEILKYYYTGIEIRKAY